MHSGPTREDIIEGLARGGYTWSRTDQNGIDLYVSPDEPGQEIPIYWGAAQLQDLWDTLTGAGYIPLPAGEGETE